MNKDLVMTFINEGGKKVTLRIKGVKDNISETEVNKLMDLIIANNVFVSKEGALTKKESAKIVQSATEEIVLS